MIGGHPAGSPAFEAVVSLGDCSGVVVAPDLVLTSAHCLPVRVDHLMIGGHRVPLVACRTYPGYQPLQWANDLGLCQLAESSPVAPIPVDESPPPGEGDHVMLAGRGLERPFGRAESALRIVDTSVTGVRSEGIHVGTSERTACRGDSGGAVLVERRGALRVAAIVHGGSGAICASPAEAILVRSYATWIHEGALGPAAGSQRAAVVGAGTGAVLVLACTWAWARQCRRA